MGTKIHYASGSIVELQEGESERFWGRASKAGFRYYQSLDNKIIPFNHPTIEYIELEPFVPKAVKKAKEAVTMKQAQEDAMTEQDKQDKLMLDRSNCTHRDSEGKTLRKLYYMETTNGRKYFPVCDFCGHREKFIGVQKLEEGKYPDYTMEDLKDAQEYKA